METKHPLVNLNDIAGVRSGYSFKSKDWQANGVPVVKIANVKRGSLELEGCSYVSEGVAETANEFELSRGDILIAMTGYVGDIAIVRSESRLLLNQRVGRFSILDDKRLDSNYLFYFLRMDDTRHQFEQLGYGSAQPNISPKLILSLSVPLPPLPEQQAIAEILGALDDKIELNRKVNATLDELARTIFRSWFIDFDPVHAKAEGRAPFGMDADTAALFPDRFTDSELGPIPEDWEMKRVNEVAQINQSSTRARDEWQTLKYIDISSTHNGEISEMPVFKRGEEPSRARRRLTHGDTALSTVRPNRRSFFLALDPPEDLIASTGFAVVSPISVPWSFLHSALTQDSVFYTLGQLADGGAYPAVRPGVIGDLAVNIPGDDQLLVAYHTVVGPLYELAAANRQESHTLAELRDTLLPELISGRIRMPDAEKLVGVAV